MIGSCTLRQYLDDRWTLLLSVWLLSATVNAFIIAPASVFPVITAQLEITSSAASWLVSIVFGVAAVVSIPVGVWLDRTDNRTAMMVATGVFIAGSVLSWRAALAGSYLLLLGARAVGGFAFPIVWNAGITLIGSRFNSDNEATAIGIFTASAPLGFAFAQFFGPYLSTSLGWATPFGIFAVPAVFASLVFWYSTHDVVTTAGESDVPNVNSIVRILIDRNVRSVGLMGFLAYSIYVFFNTWMPNYLAEDVGLSLTTSGMLFAAYPAVGVISRIGSGVVSDRFLNRRRKPVMYLAFATTLPLTALIAMTDILAVLVLSLLFAGLALQSGIGILHPYVRELADPAVAATAIAVLTTASFIGSVITPVITGELIEQTTYTLAFGYVSVAAVAGILLTRTTPEPNGA
ncbi:MFS transporter [Natrinema ejinorense]|uniref:MFS transporter n=1 Tax=Natrinema ejinorense TaxID=373386 RepID=A0A2A5QQA3_9EURY|nr:MFS transporter [Natrinema ejinorense]